MRTHRLLLATLASLAACAAPSRQSVSIGVDAGERDAWQSARARLAVDQAERWIASGRDDLAEREVERAQAVGCRTPDFSVLEARLALAKGDPDKVAFCLERARSNGAQGAPIAMLEGMVAESRLDWNRALASYAYARGVEPTLVAGWTGEIRSLMALGRSDEALTRAEQAVLQTEGAPTVYAAMGHALVATRRFADARDAYRRALAIDGEDKGLLAAYLLACYALGDCAEVMRLGARIPESECPPWFFEVVGRSALKTNDFALAEAALERHLEIRPRDVSAWLDLGRARLLAGDADGAAKAVAVAVRIAPDEPAPRTLLGHIHARAGRSEEAIACYMDALERGEDPHEVRALIESLAAHGARASAGGESCEENEG